MLILGSIGSGEIGQGIVQLLKEENIASNLYQDPVNTTDRMGTVIQTSDNEQTNIVLQKTNENYPREIFNLLWEPREDENARKKPVENCKHFFTTSFFLESNPDMVEKVMSYANTNNRSFCFNVDSDRAMINNKEKFLEVLQCADIVFMTKHQGIAFIQNLSEELGIEGIDPN